MYQRQFNILVLDEDTRALYQTVALLKQRDYVVFGAPSVDIAVWMLSQWPFDLLVAALRLGEMNGLDFIAGGIIPRSRACSSGATAIRCWTRTRGSWKRPC